MPQRYVMTGSVRAQSLRTGVLQHRIQVGCLHQAALICEVVVSTLFSLDYHVGTGMEERQRMRDRETIAGPSDSRHQVSFDARHHARLPSTPKQRETPSVLADARTPGSHKFHQSRQSLVDSRLADWRFKRGDASWSVLPQRIV